MGSSSRKEGTDVHRPHRRREVCFAALFLLLTALMTVFLSNMLRPVQTSYGSTWSGFQAEPEDSLDVIWLGSSFAYCDVLPAMAYESSGLTGYVMGGSEQTLSISYWYLKEVFRTQSPSAVMIEATSLFFEPYQNYTQVNVSMMPLSLNRLGAIFTAAEPELRTELLFDLSLYHDNWKELDGSDAIRAVRPGLWDERKGFTPMAGSRVTIATEPNVYDRPVSAEDYAANLAWLEKILALCREHGAQAIVAVHPSYTRCTPERYAQIGAEIAAMDPDALFYDWSASFEEIGLDPQVHLYDGGHLNQDGAAVFSAWLGRFLTDEVGLTPRPQTEENVEAWEASAAWWRDYLEQDQDVPG